MIKRIKSLHIHFLILILFGLLCTSSQAVSEETGITARFSWLPSAEDIVTGYTLYYSTVSGDYDKSHSVSIENTTPQQDGRIYGEISGLTEGTTYFFVVTAHDDQGQESDYSTEIRWTATSSTIQKPPTPKVISIRTIN